MGSLDPLRQRFPWGAPLSDEHPEIALLTPQDVRDLRLPWLSRFNPETLAMHLQANPGKSLWVPRTGEYVVAERWRHRDEIGNIVEVTARKGRASLVRAMVTLMREDGCRLLLMSDDVWNDQPRSYLESGFSPLEKIVFFQKDLRNFASDDTADTLPALTYRIAEHEDLDLLVSLDNNSFPWLWWNSREDMEGYMQLQSVFIYMAFADSVPVGYASFTMYSGWAHLDRLAVITPQQGRRYGAAQLVRAMNAMVAHGATHVGLSTQENNFQSHRLYKGFGFRQTRDSMNIYGLQLEHTVQDVSAQS